MFVIQNVLFSVRGDVLNRLILYNTPLALSGILSEFTQPILHIIAECCNFSLTGSNNNARWRIIAVERKEGEGNGAISTFE